MNELRLLLDAAAESGSFVLGRSFGGFDVRLFANAGPAKAIWRHMRKDLARRNLHSVHLIARYSGRRYAAPEQPEIVSSTICIAVEAARAGTPAKGLPLEWQKQRCSQP